MVAAPSEMNLFSDLRRRMAKRRYTTARTTQSTPRMTPMLIGALAPRLKAEDVPGVADEAVDRIALLVGVGL